MNELDRPGVPPLVPLLVGVAAGATSVIWIKLSTIDAAMLTALRLIIASLLLAPFAYRDYRRHRERLTWSHLRDSAIPGVFLAAHLISWNLGVRLTPAANGTLIVNLTPLVTPVLLWLLVRERVTRTEVLATLVSLMGLAVLFAADYRVSADTARGDAICFGSMLLLSVYLVLARRYRHHPTTLVYVTPLYATAGVVALGVALGVEPLTPIDWRTEAVWVLLLVLLPTIVGHSLINQAMRRMRGQLVSLVIMLQFVIAGTIAWFALGERPIAEFYPAAVLVVIGCVIAAWPTLRAALAQPDGEFQQPT